MEGQCKEGSVGQGSCLLWGAPFSTISYSHHTVLRLAAQSCPTLWPRGLQPARFLWPWDSPDKNTGVGCHALLQGIFPTQCSNPGLPHCRRILYHLSHQRRRWRLQPLQLVNDESKFLHVIPCPLSKDLHDEFLPKFNSRKHFCLHRCTCVLSVVKKTTIYATQYASLLGLAVR